MTMPEKGELPVLTTRKSGGRSTRQLRTSRTRLILVAVFSFLCISFLFRPLEVQYNRVAVSHRRPKSVEQRVYDILTSTPLIDGHIDFPIIVRAIFNNHIYNDSFALPFQQGGLSYHVDLPRLRQGMSGGAFWSVFAPCPSDGDDFSDENYAASVQFTLQQVDLMTRLQAEYPKDFSPMLDSSGAMAAFKKGQLISPLGIEGLHQIGNSVANLRRFHEMGVRYCTLTHNCHNKYADAAIVGQPMRKAEPKWGGVSPLGRQLIKEMNRIGMIVDISHVSDDTMRDVLGGNDNWQGSLAPVIYSHSSAYSICPHPRNVKDDILQLVKARNSLVMVNFYPEFTSCIDSDRDDGMPEYYPGNATIHQIARHILHIGNLIGFDHVGLGSDFDGIDKVPEGLEDVSKYPELVAQLLREGVSDEDAAKIVGGNLLRVWKDVDAVGAKMQAAGEPVMEDDLPSILGTSVGSKYSTAL